MKKILFVIIMSIFVENVHGFDFNNTDIHGFISQGFMISDRNNYYADTEDGTFEFNEMGINFSNQINDRLRVGMQFFSRDLGDMDNNELGVDWAIGDYRWRDWLGLRAGRIKNRCGLYNYTRDVEMLRTSVFLPQSVYYEGGREAMNAVDGIGVYGYVPFASSDSINYQINYGSYAIDSECAFVRLLENSMIMDILNVDSGEMFLVNLEWNTFLEGLRLSGTLVMLDVETNALSKSHPLLMAYGILPNTDISYNLKVSRNFIFAMLFALKLRNCNIFFIQVPNFGVFLSEFFFFICFFICFSYNFLSDSEFGRSGYEISQIQRCDTV